MSALSLPLANLARAARTIAPGTSLGIASAALRQNGSAILAIVEERIYRGAITEASLLAGLSRGLLETDAVELALQDVPCLTPRATGAEALRTLADTHAEGIAVVDELGHFIGLILPSDLFPKPPVSLRPNTIGGLATPFGVYLTTGRINAGPGALAMMATGGVMVLLLTLSRIFAVGAVVGLQRFHPSGDLSELLRDGIPLVLFAVLFHLVPMAGTHAAEHMVVHAVERGEPLTPEVVARMPRVHPRCGTNIATAAMLLTVLGLTDFGLSPDWRPLQLVIAFLITLRYWRVIGGWVQYWVTTRKPSAGQIESGIRSATSLIEKFGTTPAKKGSLFTYIWQSGMPMVALGGWLTGAAFALFFSAIGRLDLLAF